MSLQTECRVVNQASANKTDLQHAPEKRWSNVPTGAAFQNREFSPNHYISASRFTPTASGRLTSIDLSLWRGGFDFLKTANIDLSLTPLGPGGLPSQTVLTSGMITVTNRQPQLTTFLPSNQVFLQTGTPYWLVLAPHDANCDGTWGYSEQFSGYVAFADTPNPSLQDWRLFFADLPPVSDGVPEFRVNAVPEPSFLGMGLIGLALFVHRRRKSVSKSS